MLQFYENEYGFIKMERLRMYLTNEFKYCTLICTLVRGRNKRVFPHTLLVPWASNRLRAGGFLTFVGMRSLALPETKWCGEQRGKTRHWLERYHFVVST